MLVWVCVLCIALNAMTIKAFYSILFYSILHYMRQVRLTRSVSQALIPVPAYKNNHGWKSLHTYTSIWNDIPHHIITLPSTTYLKNTYKLHLLNTYTRTL